MKKKENKEHKHIKPNSFIMISAFMVSGLNLKGNDLLIYAIIHGFSHSNGGSFTGSLQYLAEWTNSSKQAVMNSLKKLESDGLISKNEYLINSVKNCSYKVILPDEVCKKVVYPMQKSCIGMQLSCTNIIEDNIEDKKNNNNIILDEHSPNNKVSVNCMQQNIDANCTLPIVDSIKQIYKAKKPSKTNFQTNPDMYTWINAKAKEFNQGLPKDRQFVHPNKSGKTRDERAGNMYMLRNVYEKFGEEKATEFVDYIISKGEWRNPMSILSLKNQEEFENLCQVGEQPRYLNDEWKTMQRFSRPNAEEPVVFDFPMEDALYAAWEWYFNGKGFNGSELVKKVREKIKEINHSRFNKY